MKTIMISDEERDTLLDMGIRTNDPHCLIATPTVMGWIDEGIRQLRSSLEMDLEGDDLIYHQNCLARLERIRAA